MFHATTRRSWRGVVGTNDAIICRRQMVGRIAPAGASVSSPHYSLHQATNHAACRADSAAFPLPRERPNTPSNRSRRVRAAKSHRARCEISTASLLPFACWDPAHRALLALCAFLAPIKLPSPPPPRPFPSCTCSPSVCARLKSFAINC